MRCPRLVPRSRVSNAGSWIRRYFASSGSSLVSREEDRPPERRRDDGPKEDEGDRVARDEGKRRGYSPVSHAATHDEGSATEESADRRGEGDALVHTSGAVVVDVQ